MVRMRRTEIAADLLYKQKLARGFLHLADGQEAVPVGIEAALDFKDSMIQSYRDHCTFLGRGGSVKELFAELLVQRPSCLARHTWLSHLDWVELLHLMHAYHEVSHGLHALHRNLNVPCDCKQTSSKQI